MERAACVCVQPAESCKCLVSPCSLASVPVMMGSRRPALELHIRGGGLSAFHPILRAGRVRWSAPDKRLDGTWGGGQSGEEKGKEEARVLPPPALID